MVTGTDDREVVGANSVLWFEDGGFIVLSLG